MYIDKDELHKTFMGASLDKVADILIHEYGNKFDPQLFFERSIELNKEIMKTGIPLMKGARELLDFLHSIKDIIYFLMKFNLFLILNKL